ncbi:DUF951 domain-containing protein [Alkalithermobacter paradoxus]|uniref:DUF951 domain-containing protein n=1 Tax=Alkalithermobacter paradoxus TaxID=29349 RepID=A0A1V4I6D5_9FIRM|nr:hypothetical protein CLOTH_15020 [[Clostridium] thermoalcaliphilum]
MPIKLNIGDIVELRKSHPCGNNVFEIMRVGMDFRIRCVKCDKQVWLERVTLEKRLKKIIESTGTE